MATVPVGIITNQMWHTNTIWSPTMNSLTRKVVHQTQLPKITQLQNMLHDFQPMMSTATFNSNLFTTQFTVTVMCNHSFCLLKSHKNSHTSR